MCLLWRASMGPDVKGKGLRGEENGDLSIDQSIKDRELSSEPRNIHQANAMNGMKESAKKQN